MTLSIPTFLCYVIISIAVADAQVEKAEVNLDYVTHIAEQRAKAPFRSPRANLPAVLKQDKLDYDNYRKIRFRPDRDFWLGDKLPFRAEFFHPGYIYQDPVRIFEFTKDYFQRVRFVRDWFDYGGLNIKDQIPADTGYAGFKIKYQLNKPGVYSELAAFLGASYFRMLGKDQHYGSSARGLALDCDEPDRPEEFPIFTDFWLGKPALADTSLLVYAILDSVSCVGAYQIRITPGETTVTDIDAVLFFREPANVQAASKDRKPLKTVGLAPLTSMFWFGENSERHFDDYRPQVHDSDGLLLHMDDGEVLWRPLDNPSVMRHSLFATHNIRGFGLLQRDRRYGDYAEMFNLYHQVPSLWVKPKGDWGDGEVHLVELPTTSEGLDNIVAFWNPKVTPPPMQPFRFGYQILWTRETDFQLSQNRVVATRVGLDPPSTTRRQVHLDFAGPALANIPANAPPTAVVHCSENAKISESQLVWNPLINAWRAVLKFEPAPDGKDPVELRCTLQKDGQPVSETWDYLWSPP